MYLIVILIHIELPCVFFKSTYLTIWKKVYITIDFVVKCAYLNMYEDMPIGMVEGYRVIYL